MILKFGEKEILRAYAKTFDGINPAIPPFLAELPQSASLFLFANFARLARDIWPLPMKLGVHKLILMLVNAFAAFKFAQALGQKLSHSPGKRQS
jgi:hypothetical protein